MEETRSKREVSEFNSAVSYLNRLNLLFSMCDEYAMELNPFMWFHTLMALYRELSTEMDKDELDYFKDNSTRINNEVTKWMELKQRNMQQPLSNELYNLLHEFELKLRSIMKDAGLQQKVMEDAEKALQ